MSTPRLATALGLAALLFAVPRGAEAANYHLRGDTTTNLGFDGTANLPTVLSTGTAIPYRGSMLATTATGISWQPTSIPAATNNMVDGYTAAYSANAVDISAISSSCAVRNGSSTNIWRFYLYDYNPTSGARTLMATSADVTGIQPATTTAAVPASWTISNARVQQNNRIVFRIQKVSTTTSTGDHIYYEAGTAKTGCWATFTETPVTGVVVPTLTSPTATTITNTTATLGANITSNGGAALTARGTCWGTTPAPTGNCVAEGGTAIGVFTQARTALTAGTLLYYRGYATNSAGTGYSPDGSFYTEPTTQASAVTFTAVAATSMTVNWTRGSGSGVIVLMKSGSAVNSDPVDGTYTGYTANAAFASGTQIGTGNYVIYKGTGTSVPVTALTASTTYHVAVYEYAGAIDTVGVNQGTNYKLTPAIGNQATSAVTVPTLTSPTAIAITNTTATLGANITSNGGAALTARGTCWGTTPAPTGNCLADGGTATGVFTQARIGLTAATRLFYRGYATNSAGTGYSPDGSFYTEPTTQASVVTFTAVTTTTMTVNWTRGSGGGVIVLMKQGVAVDADPADGTYTGYTASAAFGVGTQLGTGNYVLYKGTGASVPVTGLSASTTYHVAVYEYAGTIDTVGVDQGTNYKLTPARGSQATPGDNRTTPGTPTAAVGGCTQITVAAPFSGDANGSSTTTVSRGPSGTGPWTAVCTGLVGTSPRSCLDNGVLASTTYYYQVDFTDTDGVLGADPQVIGPFNTPSCIEIRTTPGSASMVVSGCRQITVAAPFAGDGDSDGAVLVEYSPTNTWPGTSACGAVGGPSPRMCLITGLTPSSVYFVRVTYSDPDGILGGTNPQLLGSLTTTACTGNGAPPMILPLAPSVNAVVGGLERFRVQVYDPDGVVTANVLWGIDGGALANTGVTQSTTYSCNIGSQIACKIFEFDLSTPALANGSHYVTVQATDSAAAPAAVGRHAWGFVVNNSGATAAGSGELLRRTHGSQLCVDCHNLATHSSQATSFTYGTWGEECLTCHTPHATKNIYLVREAIETPNSGKKSVDFRNLSGKADFSFATVTAPGNGACEVCHTKTRNSDSTPRYRNSGGSDGGKHYSSSCINCHNHGKGFAAGESDGNADCVACHAFGMVTSEATRTSTYHHVMEIANKITSGLTVYPTLATPTSSTADQDKSCTQCHADHNVFRPDINTGNTLGRGANLRSRIATGPPTAATGTNLNAAPGDVAGSYYSNKDADATFNNGGVCLSCHLNAQTKNVTDQKTYTGDPGQTAAIVSAAASFPASAHGFTVGGQIANGSSAFSVACAKCHGETTTTYQNGTYRFDVHTSANRRMLQTLGITTPVDPLEENFCWRCHSRTTDTTPGGGPVKGVANRDYYNQVAMSAQSESVFNQFTNTAAYPWDHPVQGSGGLHDPVEGTAASDGTLAGAQRHVQCEDCHNPHAAAPIATTAMSGTITGFTTNADPNPDLLTDSARTWTVNALKGFTVKMTSGAQAGKYSAIYANAATTLSVNFAIAPVATDKYIVINWGVTSTNTTWTGNRVSPAMADVWGLNPTWVAQPTPPIWNDSAGTSTAAEITGQYNAVTTWGRTSSATVQGQICIKCHSAYAYGASPPNTPSGDGNSTSTTWVNTAGTTTAQSDIASQFNPNNLSHHAIFARGKNQPLVSSDATTSTYNPNWPKYTTGTLTATNGSTAITLAGGTWPTTTLPGWFLYIGNIAPAQALAGWYEVTVVGSTTTLTLDRAYTGTTGASKAYMLTAGLGNNFVPPWGPWSTLSCSDCHTSSVQSDPFGPHGSAVKWLLRGGEAQNFLFYNGTSVATVTFTPDSYNLCLNCHRRDVYGDYAFAAPTSANYGRQTHPADAGRDHSLQDRSAWGIACMNCHGGARIGQIHGSNLGKGNGGVTALSYSGRRLLAGSSWYAVTRGSTTVAGKCWTKGGADEVNTCGRAHDAAPFESGVANYNYDSAAD